MWIITKKYLNNVWDAASIYGGAIGFYFNEPYFVTGLFGPKIFDSEEDARAEVNKVMESEAVVRVMNLSDYKEFLRGRFSSDQKCPGWVKELIKK